MVNLVLHIEVVVFVFEKNQLINILPPCSYEMKKNYHSNNYERATKMKQCKRFTTLKSLPKWQT